MIDLSLDKLTVGQDEQFGVSMGMTTNMFRAAYSVTVAVASLLPLMVDPEDARRVRAILQTTYIISLRDADTAINVVTRNLTAPEKPAIIAEVRKARDQMVVIREQLRTLQQQGSGP
jgi:hypothetical protein